MNVPKLRFSEFNDEFILDNFNNLINTIDGDRGNNYPKESDFFENEYCLFLNAGNVTKNGFNFENNSFITQKKDDELRNGKLKRNDIILTTRGTVGNVALYDDSIEFENVRINSGMIINRIEDQTKLIPLYVYQYMKSSKFEAQVKKANFGSAQPQLTKNGIGKFIINYTSLKEQEKIGNMLSLFDKKIELQSKKIEDLKLYKICTSNLFFTNNKPNNFIKNFCNIVTGQSKTNQLDSDGNYIVMDMGSVSSEGNIIESKKSNYLNDILQKGDLIMPKDDIGGGLIIAKTAYIPENDKYILGDHVYCLKTKNINSLYFHYLINSKNVNKNLKRKVTGSAQLGINSKSVLSQEIFVHNENEQEKIANVLSKIDKKIELENNKFVKLQELKKGLMQSMFV